MKTSRFALILLFCTSFLLGTCDSDDSWDGTICPVRCPDSKPWVVAHTSASTCYETKEECEATGPGGDYGCIKCDY